MASEAEFWKWSLSRWKVAGVESQLLELQDNHELVVLEILMAAWIGTLGIRLGEPEWQAMIQAADPWVNGVVLPLRRQRVLWKAQPAHAGLYSEVKTLELAAERSLASIYVEAVVGAGASGSASGASQQQARDTVAANLIRVLSRAQPAVGPEVAVAVTELLAT